MRWQIEAHEPERDPELEEALRAAYPEATLDDAAARAIRARVRDTLAAGPLAPAAPPAAAAPGTALPFDLAAPGTTLPVDHLAPGAAVPLQAARSHRTRSWARPRYLLPALLAASVAGALLIGREVARRSGTSVPPVSLTTQAVGYGSAEQALEANVSDTEFARVVTREDDPAALLAIAVAPLR